VAHALRELRIGTRGSLLALWQANTVAARLTAAGAPPCRIVVIKTTGDELQDRPLSDAGGKRLFVREIEDALLQNDVDLAVHSSKDMPAQLPEGLGIAGVLPREDPLDAVVLPAGAEGSGLGPPPSALDDLIAALGPSPSIGTGSVRRVAQLLNVFPRARFTNIRGNLDTRLRKLDAGEHQAIILAAAGLRRLGFASRISLALPVDVCVPSPGQGIVAIEIRHADAVTRAFIARISDANAAAALDAERALVEALGGGCQTPIGALASPLDGGRLGLVAAVAAPDGSRIIRASSGANRDDAVELGMRVGHELIAKGASEILAEVRT
jgi:hydroxymethylbilane synthase